MMPPCGSPAQGVKLPGEAEFDGWRKRYITWTLPTRAALFWGERGVAGDGESVLTHVVAGVRGVGVWLALSGRGR